MKKLLSCELRCPNMGPAYHVTESKKPENPEKPAVVAEKLSRSLFDHFYFTRRVGLFTIYTKEKPV